MKLTWLGHSGFRLETGDLVILIDPWLSGNPMLPDNQHAAAVHGATHILLTHAHFDHMSDTLRLARENGIPVIGQFDLMNLWSETEKIETIGFNKGGTITLDGIRISMVTAQHSSTIQDETGLRPAGSEVGYMIAAEGQMIYVSGDTDIMADMEWFADYYKPDIGILCAGGHFTMDMDKVAYIARRWFNFRTIIPCHYRTFPVLEQSAAELVKSLPGIAVIEPDVMRPIPL
ncbi:metal-dependent hydrolase [Pontibaca methylaminivorans]|uniref:metal-dependent hydrolase n=1 Tax=Pontibaca methylaminivorans TaxID=515897 RepID=UPI002FDB777C